MPAPPPDRPGLQSERTSLAWDRTAASFVLLGLLLLLRPAESLTAARAASAALALLLAVAVVAFGRRATPRVARREIIAVSVLASGFALSVAVMLAATT